MTDKQIIEYKHIKCTKEDCCLYCGSIYCGYVDDIENLEKAYKAKEQECEELKKQIKYEFDETLLQYSNTIEDLQKQLKDSVMKKCPQCGEAYLNPVGAKLYEALIEIKELVQSDYCTEIGSCEFCAEIGNCLNKKILHKISECEGNNE